MSDDEPEHGEKDRGVAVVLALFLGGFGVHRFYLGQSKKAFFYLLFSWTGIPVLLGWVDAVRLMSGGFEEFFPDQSGQITAAQTGARPSPSRASTDSQPRESFDGQRPGEELLMKVDAHVGEMMGSGDDKQINGELILTNQRVSFRGSRFLSSRSEDIRLGQVRNVSLDGGMVMATLKINHFKFTIHEKKEGKKFQRALYRAMDQDKETVASQSTSTNASPLEKIERLQELHDAGALTDEEFQTKKEKLLEKV